MDILQISVIISQSMTLLKKIKTPPPSSQTKYKKQFQFPTNEESSRFVSYLRRQPSYPQKFVFWLEILRSPIGYFSRCGIQPKTLLCWAYWLDKLTCCTVLHKLFASTLIWENFQINVQLHFSPFQQLFSMILRTKSTFPRLFQDGNKISACWCWQMEKSLFLISCNLWDCLSLSISKNQLWKAFLDNVQSGNKLATLHTNNKNDPPLATFYNFEDLTNSKLRMWSEYGYHFSSLMHTNVLFVSKLNCEQIFW